ncbi:MAG: septal ring lytic transglycosylase RlpA family protein [Thermaerobacterales bacterium]
MRRRLAAGVVVMALAALISVLPAASGGPAATAGELGPELPADQTVVREFEVACGANDYGKGPVADVMLDGLIVMRLRTGGPLTLMERCEIIAGRLRSLLVDHTDRWREIRPETVNGHIVITAGGMPVVTVLQDAADANQTSTAVLAWVWANRLREALSVAALDKHVMPLEGADLQAMHASWYGPGFHGRLTANGERYDQYQLTAAHRTLPFGTILRVIDEVTGRQVLVRVNDRGPFIRGRQLDLSFGAAQAIGLRSRGVGPVLVELVYEPD